MSFITTSKKYYDQFTGSGGGGVTYLNGGISDTMTTVIDGYFYWAFENGRMTYTASTKTISILGTQNNNTFTRAKFRTGDTITIANTTSNNGNFTIVSMSDNFIVVAETIIDEVAEGCNVYGTTLITAIDFYYNLIQDSEQENYVSKTDVGTLQKYFCGGLDASVSTPVYMNAGTDSYGWLTHPNSGTYRVKVEGAGISDYKQSFKITQTLYITPIWTSGLQQNFRFKTIPDYFKAGRSLKHISKVDGKYNINTPVIAQTGSQIDVASASFWFNQNSINSRSDYSVESITYQDADTNEWGMINSSIVNYCTVILKSTSGKFDTGTKFKVSIFQNPLNNDELINTQTTLLQNIKEDEQIVAIGDSATNGIHYGNDYQSLTTVLATLTDANTATLTFQVDYSDYIKNYLANKVANDRNYTIAISTQDVAITTTEGNDRTILLVDYQNQLVDFRNKNLFGLQSQFFGYRFPDVASNEINNVVGFEGDYFYERVPFWIESDTDANGVTPTLDTFKIQIVATKDGETDFIIEEKIFNTSNIRKLSNQQTINIDGNRTFILPDNSFYNRANLVRTEYNDDGTKLAYELQYGFVLRYEYWNDVLVATNATPTNILSYVSQTNNKWSQYSGGFGWSLQFRIEPTIVGYDGNKTTFQAQTPIDVALEQPIEEQLWKKTTQYFDENNSEIEGVLLNATTRILSTFSGDTSIIPTGFQSFYGTLFVDNVNTGGIFNRRFVSTELNSESDSPFSTIDLPTNSSYVSIKISNNLRMTIYSDRIELDTFYTDTDVNEDNIIVMPRIGYIGNDNILLMSDNTPLLTYSNDSIFTNE